MNNEHINILTKIAKTIRGLSIDAVEKNKEESYFKPVFFIIENAQSVSLVIEKLGARKPNIFS